MSCLSLISLRSGCPCLVFAVGKKWVSPLCGVSLTEKWVSSTRDPEPASFLLSQQGTILSSGQGLYRAPEPGIA